MLLLLSNTLFLLLVIVILTTVVFYSLIRLNKEQKKNINELKYAGEKKYLELADLLPQIVFECDFDGNITFLNNIGKNILGIDRIDIQNGIKIKSILIDSDRKRFEEDFLYIREGGLNKGQEYLVKTKDESRVPMIFYMSHILTDGKITGVRGIVIDITERKILERKILSAVIETEDKERQRFSEDLHDGLGPLLSTIRLYFNQLNLKNLSEEEKESLLKTTYDMLDEAISTTRSIANNILPGTISDNGLVSAINSFCHRVQHTGVVNFEIDSNLEKRLDRNIEKTIYRIVIELINNTIKHANATEVRLSIYDHGDIVEITYSDNGSGFDMERVTAGLGLENIRNRCKSIDADLVMESGKGKGFKTVMTIKKNNN
jgi:PAS domain S-box-containing protein